MNLAYQHLQQLRDDGFQQYIFGYLGFEVVSVGSLEVFIRNNLAVTPEGSTGERSDTALDATV